MPQFLYGHAEWVETRDLILGNFDSHLRIKVMALRSFPICLYWEAMHLQCFPPTRYVRGGAARAHKRDDLYPIWSNLEYRLPACIAWLYYAV